MSTQQDKPLVLVVGDDPSIVDTVTELLMRAGLRTCHASDLSAALQQIQKQSPDLIADQTLPRGGRLRRAGCFRRRGRMGIAAKECRARECHVTDIEMPRLDGLGLTRRVRADLRTARLPIIALTSLAADDDAARGIAAGVSDYQTKLDRDRLLERLREYTQAKISTVEAMTDSFAAA